MGGRNTTWAPAHTALRRNPIGGAGIDPNASPSLGFLGAGLQDHRYSYNARGSSALLPGILGWYGEDPIVADIVPSAIATANIAALANVVNGTAMTLVSASGAGITVLTAATAGPFLPNPIRGAGPGPGVGSAAGATVTVFGASGQNTVPSGACVIDGIPTLQTFGSSAAGNFTTGFYDPSTCVGRAISISGVASGTGGTFVVKGFDVYGFPLTQNVVVGAGANTVNSTKAFKAVTSVTPQFTDAHNYSVGTADIYGLGIFTRRFSHLAILWNEAWITAATGFVAADTTNPATATTGDVRGTYAVQSASDGTKRLVVYATPSLPDLATDPTFGLFGRQQF